jgi:hypothetical protein
MQPDAGSENNAIVKGKLTFACGQVYEMLYEIEKVWRGTMSIAAVWRFKNMALLKS